MARRVCVHQRAGKPLAPDYVTHQDGKLRKSLGLGPERLPALQYVSATMLIEQGVHLRAVMEVLGHSSCGLTMSNHGHVAEAVQRAPAPRMGRALGG
jgi:site-specific recombinase XerD